MSSESGSTEQPTIRARMACAPVLGGEVEAFESPLTVLASPAWRGVEADIWRAIRGSRSVIVKQYHADTADYVDTAAAIEAATMAGEIGVGPKVLLGHVDAGLVILDDLRQGWTAGGLHHAVDPGIRSSVIAAKRRFQTGLPLGKTTNIFDEIDALYSRTATEGIRTHTDIRTFRDFLDDARCKIASLGHDLRPCHRDGNTSNLMVHQDGRVQLLDFDLAANCDPFEDIGCYLVEFFESDADARPGFEEWHGTFSEGLFQRSMLYGLADHMRWGLIGAIMAAISPRRHLEFGKYASWRFLRLEMHAKRSDANDRIRSVA